jgi:hypothetical protein
MASQEELDRLLKQGVQSWNLWRAEYPDVPKDLSGADLSDAYLYNADLSGADLEFAVLGDVDLSTVRGLETVKDFGPSTIGIDTIYCSQGKIPEAFLKKAGVPYSFIDYTRSLVGSPIDYYSCFISYSSKVQAFAERLYADLQSKGVRCWFAPHVMRIGDEIRSRIDETIRIHDKLLLVLSESSLASNWVKKELETAFEKEAQQQKLVLFPVRVDDTVMHTQEAWAADIRRMRHIGDLTRWKGHDEYQQSFARCFAISRRNSMGLIRKFTYHHYRSPVCSLE